MENNYRYAGEFEEQEAVILCWPRPAVQEPVKGMYPVPVFVDIIKAIVDQVEVYVNCGFEGTYESCTKALTEAGVDMTHVHITRYPDIMHWARDYGPDILKDENGNMRLANFKFDMYGEGDEDSEMSVLCTKFAPHMAIEFGCYDFVNSNLFTEGGDKEFNGHGVLMAIEDTEVRKRNGQYTKEQVEEDYKRMFNLKKFIWLPLGIFDDESATDGVLDVVDGKPVYRCGSANGHIDEMARFVDKNTVLLAEVPEEEAEKLNSARITKERLDACLEVLKNSTDEEGNPIKIIRIPTPVPFYVNTTPEDWANQTWGKRFSDNEENLLDDGTVSPEGEFLMRPAMSYCNFLICNKVVVAQSYWKEGLPEEIKKRDAEALAVLQKAFPDRKIVAVPAMDLNIRGGGIHCVTKNIQK